MTVKTTGRRARKRQGSTDMTTPSTHAGTPALANLDSLYSQIAAPLPPVQFTGATGARYNMGAGQPDPASLPKMELIETLEGIFSGPEGDLALMYGDAAGFIGLREVLAAKLKRWEGIETNPKELLIVNGSNHGLATVAQAFLNVGDTAICEAPTFMGGLRPLRQLQAKVHGIPLDDDGMRIDLLEAKLKELVDAGTPAKLVYTIPNFHNPAGVNLSLSRRHRLAELADLFNFVILEDDAYGELRFSGEHIAAIYTMATPGRVVRSATLSKILSAGMRVGYLLAPEPVIARLNAMKLDGGASPFTNRLAAGYYSQHGDAHIHQLIGIYRHKRDALVRGLREGFADAPALKPVWRIPNGGFFLWMRLPDGVDPVKVAKEAGDRGVAYVGGPAFFADGSGREYIRLAWSMLSEPDLVTAGHLVAESIKVAAHS